MSFAELVDGANGFIWSIPLVGLCLVAGLYFTIRTRLVQVLGIPDMVKHCLLYTSPSPRDKRQSRMPSSA
ncbi:MAG TPA: hypothetical protein DD664_06540 [Janibacter terrae]|nr:hypothetical protein [Janibacter terrae]